MTRLFLIIAVLTSVCSGAVAQSIDDIVIDPAFPTIMDVITASISGMKQNGGLYVDHTSLSQAGFDLTLDMYWENGLGIPEETPYTHDALLGVLEEGDYSLTVHSYMPAIIPMLTDSAWTCFTVNLPEPVTGLLLGGGGLFLLRRRRD